MAKMKNTTKAIERLIARYGSHVAACYAIEDRAIRCKTARCEAILFYLAEATDLHRRMVAGEVIP